MNSVMNWETDHDFAKSCKNPNFVNLCAGLLRMRCMMANYL